MNGNANAVTGRERFIGSNAKTDGIPAPVTGLRATLMESDAKWTECEMTPMGSGNHLDGSKILEVENTTESVGKETNPTKKINFPMDSRARFLGKTIPLPDGVMLFIGFLRFP